MPVVVELDVAGVAAGARQASGRLILRNVTDQPIAFQAMQLESPSLAYEVVDTAGRPVPLLPPPVPDPDAAPVVVDPQGDFATEHAAILPEWTEPGRYQIRARVFLVGLSEPIYSDWTDIAI